ncbi:indole-3-glycerol phosphate synthase TrpC [Alphaproteobacteria bacterium]|nr:indole-3-glycerol phosphate synthase TrpC [Alphaproteobacteria bacterium]
MNSLLKDICSRKKKEIEVLKSKCSIKSLQKLLGNKLNRDFKKLLKDSQQKEKNNIIAEIKQASPSAGVIIKDYYPEDIAVKYEKAGAGAISVLTEKNFFKGNIDHLSLINTKTNIPILRKDFIIDPYQIYESKVYKADSILLIMTILEDNEIKEYIKIANDIGLDCIIETHTLDEINRALKINYPTIGINNRNLDNLSVNINKTLDMIDRIPKSFTVIGESGIKSNENIKKYNDHGVYNFLIGETILRSSNYDSIFKKLLNK